MLKTLAATAVLLLAADAAHAEIVQRHANGFTLQMSAPVRAGWGQAFVAVGAVDDWWNPDHTYSRDAANLSLPLALGACFCERLADGSIFEHGRIIALDPRHEVRLEAPLGPLKGRATSAVLTFGWRNTIGGDQVLTLTYVVEGEGLADFAGPVDQVMTDQFTRWTQSAVATLLRPAPIPTPRSG